MKITKALAFGVLLWLIMFAGISAILDSYTESDLVKVVVAVIGGVISWALAGWLAVRSKLEGFLYGFIFVATGLVLDYLVTRQFNADIFSNRALWLGYFLVLIAPALRVHPPETNTVVPEVK